MYFETETDHRNFLKNQTLKNKEIPTKVENAQKTNSLEKEISAIEIEKRNIPCDGICYTLSDGSTITKTILSKNLAESKSWVWVTTDHARCLKCGKEGYYMGAFHVTSGNCCKNK